MVTAVGQVDQDRDDVVIVSAPLDRRVATLDLPDGWVVTLRGGPGVFCSRDRWLFPGLADAELAVHYEAEDDTRDLQQRRLGGGEGEIDLSGSLNTDLADQRDGYIAELPPEPRELPGTNANRKSEKPCLYEIGVLLKRTRDLVDADGTLRTICGNPRN